MLWFNRSKRNISKTLAFLEQQKKEMGRVCFEDDLYGGESLWSLGYVAGFTSFVFHGKASYTKKAVDALAAISSQHTEIMHKLYGQEKAEYLRISGSNDPSPWMDGYENGRRDADTADKYGEYGASWLYKVLDNEDKIWGMYNAQFAADPEE